MGSNALDVYDSANLLMTRNPLPAGSKPAYVAVAGTTAYVALPGTNQLTVLTNVTTGTPALSAMPLGGAPYGVATAPALSEVIATNSADGTASVLSTTGAPALLGTPTTGSLPDGVAVALTPTATYDYAANEQSNTVSVIALR